MILKFYVYNNSLYISLRGCFLLPQDVQTGYMKGMLNLGLWEMLMVAGVALVFVGPERLPEMLRFMGRTYGKLRAMTYDIRREFTIEVDRSVAEERTRVMQERRLEMRRRLEEERKKQADVNDEQYEPEPEHVPFGMTPQHANTTPVKDGVKDGVKEGAPDAEPSKSP